MWIVYQKKDRKVVGMSAMGGSDIDKDDALKEVVAGLVNGSAVNKYDALQVTDMGQALALMTSPVEHLVVHENGAGKVQASIQAPQASVLLVQSDAPDLHPVDGMPGIKADGTTFTTLTVTKVNERGEAQKSRNDNDELHLRSTAGTLQSADGKAAIRSIRLKQGQASLRLSSEQSRRVATVTVLCADPNVRDGSISIEFI